MKNQIDQSTPFLAFYDLLRIRGIYAEPEKREKLRRGFRRAMALAAAVLALALPQRASADSVLATRFGSQTASIAGGTTYDLGDYGLSAVGGKLTLMTGGDDFTINGGATVFKNTSSYGWLVDGGTLTSSAWVYFLSPKGIEFSGGTIDVQGIVAAAMSSFQFNNTGTDYKPSDVTGDIKLNGTAITSATANQFFIGRTVTGAPDGATVVETSGLAAADTDYDVTFSVGGAGTIKFVNAKLQSGTVSTAADIDSDLTQSGGALKAANVTGKLTQSGGTATVSGNIATVEHTTAAAAATSASAATIGTIVQAGAGTVTVSDKVTGAVAQSGGTLTTPKVEGAVTQTAGTINGVSGLEFSKTLDNAGTGTIDAKGVLTLGAGAAASDATALRSAGLASTTTKVVQKNGTITVSDNTLGFEFQQDGGTANAVTFGGNVTQNAGTINATTKIAGTVTQSGGTLTTPKVEGAVTQTAGTLNGSSGLEITGTLDNSASSGSVVAGGNLKIAGGSVKDSAVTATKLVQTGGTLTVSDNELGIAFRQEGGTANVATFTAGVEQKAASGSAINATTISGGVTQEADNAGAISATTVNGGVTQAAGNTGTISATQVNGTVEQTAGTIQAKDAATGLSFDTAFGAGKQQGEIKAENGTITLAGGDTLSGTVSANNLTAGTGNITVVSGADVDVTATLTAGTLDVDGGAVDAKNVVATVDQDGGAVTVTEKITGNVTLDGTGATMVAPEITGTVTQGAAADGSMLGDSTQNLTIGGKLMQTAGTANAKKLTLTGGAEQKADGALVNADEVILAAAGADVTLDKSNAIKAVGGEAKAITLNTTTALEQKALTAGGNVDLDADGALTQSGALEAGNQVVELKGSEITLSQNVNAKSVKLEAGTTQSGGIVTADEVILAAAGKDITLDKANAIGKVGGAAQKVTLNTTTALEQKALTAGGNVDLDADGALTQSGALEAGNQVVELKGSEITLSQNVNAKSVKLKAGTTQSGGIVTADEVILDAAGANITLDKDNAIQVVGGSAQQVTLKTTTALGQKSLTATGDVGIEAGGNITVSGDLSAAGKSVVLKATGAGSNVTVADGKKITANALGIEAGTIPSLDGNKLSGVTALALRAKTGDVTLNDVPAGVAQNIGVVAEKGDVTITSTVEGQTVKFKDVTVAAGNLSVEANGLEATKGGVTVDLSGKNAALATANITAGGAVDVDVADGKATVGTVNANGTVSVDAQTATVGTVRGQNGKANSSAGAVHVRSTSGNATVTDVRGRSVEVVSDTEDVVVKTAVNATSGNVTLFAEKGSIRGGNVTAQKGAATLLTGKGTSPDGYRTGGGEIDVGAVDADGHATVNGTTVHAGSITGNGTTVRARTGDVNVTGKLGNGGETTVTTPGALQSGSLASGAAATLDIGGAANVGALAVGGNLAGETGGAFTTSGGNAGSIGQEDGDGFNVGGAFTQGGALDTGAMTVQSGSYAMNGNLNAGGSTVQITAPGGIQDAGGATLTSGTLTLTGGAIGTDANPMTLQTANGATLNASGSNVYLEEVGTGRRIQIGTISANGELVLSAPDIGGANGLQGGFVGGTVSSGGNMTLNVGGQIGANGYNPVNLEQPVTVDVGGNLTVGHGNLDLANAPDAYVHALLNLDGQSRYVIPEYSDSARAGFVLQRFQGGGIQVVGSSPEQQRLINRALAFTVNLPELKSKQGVFGDPAMVHTKMNVSEARSMGNIDQLALNDVDFTRTWRKILDNASTFEVDWNPAVDLTGEDSPVFKKMLAVKSEAEQQPEVMPFERNTDED